MNRSEKEEEESKTESDDDNFAESQVPERNFHKAYKNDGERKRSSGETITMKKKKRIIEDSE